MREMYPIFGGVFQYTFYFFVGMTMVNITLAIIMDSYAEVMAEARREGAGGQDRAVAAMMITQLGALISECEAEIQRRAEGGSFGHGSLIADGSLVEDGPGERPSLRAILADRNLVKLDRWLQGNPSPAVLARLLHQEKKFALARGNDDSGSDDDDDGYPRC